MGVFVDIQLWAWAAFLAQLLRHVYFRRRFDILAVIGLVALALCAAIAIDVPTKDYSFVRAWLPDRPAASIAKLPWESLQFLLIPILGVATHFCCLRRGWWRDWQLVATLALSVFTVGVAVGVTTLAPSYTLWIWMLCAGSAIAAMAWVPDRWIRALCLSLAALAFHRTMAETALQWSALALTTLAVWGLFWDFAERRSVFEGLFLVTVGFWVYSVAGEDTTFGHITVAEGQRLLGRSDFPEVLVAAVVLKHLVAFGLPIFPWLATRPFRSVMATLPFFGTFAAGNLTLLWLDHFVTGGNGARLTSHPGYAHCLFGLMFLCVLWTLWIVFALLDRLSTWLQAVVARRGEAMEPETSAAMGSE
jgi:hypothetical protein